MRIVFVLLLVMTFYPLLAGSASAIDVAVIINKENPTDDVSFKSLVRIFRQGEQYWKDGNKIYLIMQEAGSPEKEIVLKKLYRMSDEEVKKFWLAKMFKGEIPSFPTTFSSNEAVKRFVSQVPNAIGFLDASFVDSGVKVLRIDGKLPGEAGYALGDR